MSNFLVPILDLPRQSGSMKEFDVSAPAPGDMGTELIGAVPGRDIDATGMLTSVEDGILASGSADIVIHGECSRCLGDIDQTMTVSFNDLYVYDAAVAKLRAEGDEEADDLFIVGEQHIDLEPAIRDALVLQLPFTPLCSEDCQGLCAGCGQPMAQLPSDHAHEVLDPRWSAVASLLTTNDDQSSSDTQPVMNPGAVDEPHVEGDDQ